MITSKTDDSVRFRRPDKSEVRLQADEYGVAITVTDPNGTVAHYPLTPSDTELVHQFLGEVLPIWDKDEI